MGHQLQQPLEGKFQTRQEYWRTSWENSVFLCFGCCLLLFRSYWRGAQAEVPQSLAEIERKILHWWFIVQVVQEFQSVEMTFTAERSHRFWYFKPEQL